MFKRELKDLVEQLKLDADNKSKEIEQLRARVKELDVDIVKSEISKCQNELSELKSQIIDTNTDVVLQDLGDVFYTSDLILVEIEENKNKQKHCLMNNGIDIEGDGFVFNGSVADGNKILMNYTKMFLGSFNRDCDAIINKVKTTNLSNSIKSIYTLYNRFNKMGLCFNVSISDDLLDLKIKMCELMLKLQRAKQEEAEQERINREIIKDQLKAEKEIADEKRRLEIELNKKLKDYNNRIISIGEVEEVEAKIKENEKHSKNTKSGWVYVVSNDDMAVYGDKKQLKIGVTRRLNVEDRIKELGGASHSFRINLHGCVFVDDCFALESALHSYFSARRVNQANRHKEWFITDYNEVQQAFKEVANIDIDLRDVVNDDYIYSKNLNKLLK